MMKNKFSFFVRVYGSAAIIPTGTTSDTVSVPTMPRIEHDRSPAPLAIDFDSLGRELEQWPNLYFEWDGSFVWVSPQRLADGSPAWQVDGMLYDHAGALQYVELKGHCPMDAWRKLISAMGLATNSQPPIIHDVSNDRWLDIPTFEQIFIIESK